MIRIGVYSFAHVHTEAYIQALRATAGVELIGVADDETERGLHESARLHVHQFATYADLLAAKPDGVLICVENAHHRVAIETALAAGIRYILCEKPLATTLADGRAIVEAVQRADARLMTAFPVRFSPAIRDAKAAIEAGQLGTIYGCNAINQGENPGQHRGWFVDQELAGGGALMDHIVHVVDVLRWVFHSEISEVYAESGDLFPRAGSTVETAGMVMLRFANGAFVGLDCSWSRPHYYPTWGNLKIDFVGSAGLIAADVFAQKLTVYRDMAQRPAWVGWGSDLNLALIGEFAASILNDRQPSITGEDGLRALEVVIAAYRSAETHQPVALPLIN